MIVAFREVFESRLQKLEQQLEQEIVVPSYKPLLEQEIQELKEVLKKLESG